ncbi:MAG: head GIN domain-containing protein [bacterium]
MTRKILTCLIAATLLLCLSCSDDDDDSTNPQRLTGSGVLTTVERTLPTFHSVALITVGNVILTSGNQQSVEITIDDNLLEYLETEVSGGELRVKFDDAVDPQDFELRVEITMTDLQSISLVGVGTISSLNMFTVDSVYVSLTGVGTVNLEVDTDKLVSVMTGVGTIALSGEAENMMVTHSGVGHLAAFGLKAGSARITQTGVGDSEVYVEDHLDVTITGAGSVYYKGSPEFGTITITGVGQLINAN